MFNDPQRHSADVERHAGEGGGDRTSTIEELQSMRDRLLALANASLAMTAPTADYRKSLRLLSSWAGWIRATARICRVIPSIAMTSTCVPAPRSSLALTGHELSPTRI
ncbi:hypothetical protein ACNKHR_04830 [Shigella flexneri]